MRHFRTITYRLGQHPIYAQEVYFLKFSYCEETKEEVKGAINSLRSEFSSRTFRPSHQVGGWLNDKNYRCWFVDPSVWRSFRGKMECEDYSFYDSEEDQEEDDQYYDYHRHHQHHRQNQASTSPIKVNIFTNWLKISSDNQLGLHSAYKDLCLLLHPDRQPSEKLRAIADDLMKRINADFDEFRKAKAS